MWKERGINANKFLQFLSKDIYWMSSPHQIYKCILFFKAPPRPLFWQWSPTKGRWNSVFTTTLSVLFWRVHKCFFFKKSIYLNFLFSYYSLHSVLFCISFWCTTKDRSLSWVGFRFHSDDSGTPYLDLAPSILNVPQSLDLFLILFIGKLSVLLF